ncbi:PIN domain-containing protein [Ramlibacter sp.]|uniref:PIN domain-containing protein n=1 Tax=Ramlibacter sp. TaxID=1917967 RepID=UPI003D15316F
MTRGSRVFLDANILLSAARSDGAIRALLRLLREAGHQLVVDAFVMEEARRNLERKVPDALSSLERLTTVLECASMRAMPDPEAAWLAWLPAKDRPVLASASLLRCDFLITGDRTHFGAGYGRNFEGVVLLSPAMAGDTLLTD